MKQAPAHLASQGELLKLRLAVEKSGEIIFMTDAAGVITYVNPAFVQLYGYTADELIGRTTPRILKGGATSNEEYASFWQQLRDRRVVRREFVNRTKSGATVFVESSANPIVMDGELVGFLAVQRDITTSKRLERELAQAQKMEAIGRLAGGVAHDFNNLLTAILGYSDLVLERVASEESLAADVGEIKRAGERAGRLTRQLLTFSRKQAFQAAILDLNEIVTELEKMLNRVIGEDVSLEIVTDPRLARIKGDAGQLEQLIVNLVVNARDAMPRGGTIRITTANSMPEGTSFSHNAPAAGRYVALAVQDTGCGMTPDVLAHAFEPFFTTKPAGKGTGLGLSTVHGIVTQSGGCVAIDSTPGVGTTVTSYLPALDASDQPEATTDTLAVRPGRETILLAEDDAGLHRLIARTLERHGYTVLTSQSSADAMSVAESHAGTIDLIVSDVIMPGLSGPDLAQRIIRHRPHIKVLYISGFPNHAAFSGAVSRNICFLAKPFTPAALAAKVRECLDARQ